MINLDKFILEKKQKIDLELKRILEKAKGSLLYEPMKYAVFSGGKRFRALLTLCSGESLGAKEEKLLPYACAIELIHNYSLIHDDLPSMDNDDFRRGKPTLHKVYGEGIAVLTGDGLLTLSFQVLSSLTDPFTLKVINIISKAAGIKGMINGQAMDLNLNNLEADENDFIELSLRKTACLIIAAVKTGGIVAQTDKEKIEALEIYGRNLGIAYQIVDDILDMAEEKKENRLNYALLLGKEKAEERAFELEKKALFALEKAGIESQCLEYLLHKAIHRKE
jgi:geranylgeranyl diphosphate synthase type II